MGGGGIFTESHGDNWRYVAAWGKWLKWDGTRWAEDATLEVRHLIRLLCRDPPDYPWLRHLFADGGYAGDKLKDALADLGTWTIDIIKRPAPGYPRPRHLGGVGLRRHSESLRPVGPS